MQRIKSLHSQSPPRTNRIALPITKGNHTIYEYEIDPDRILKRRIKGRSIGNRRRIEFDDVCGHSRSKLATISESKARRRQRCHLSNCLRECHDFFLAHVPSENARKTSRTSRMRTPPSCGTIDSESAAVAAYHSESM